MSDLNKNIADVRFSKLFEDAYGSPTELADILDLGLEMLFYVEEGAFSQREIQQVVTALRDINGMLKGKS
ncbi:hypothetical protein [Flagellimonas aequoris]|uniref:Uncharacterized protein n=1 Tax=Flagellimonas aequoris TaxID=2306997 RepID=A0A418NBD3_9FLAO|nr:hypothetical protein [Allomuricauda aequoris]RIV73888.1 hypothetical protein D2U88_02300 [Allomuricauda aequoris]TXK07575.1 hypothetical protein FQ019_02280 [Allomuricauda aequoris]